ncbi:hepatitis A virus cellular receptor 2 isoform X2 [Leptonychotes weddellii]|uniref:Hepatitis A virus cellular receptor 2 isoform X2 n=1 Tax=Leptonychotes weddellii TaxID=9713 RepID=A0A7F8QI08_LEPWE|nr:hepatitis A virus cellular receptor 2 isoform X2 [Leptonychotes weddellii]
MVSPLCFDCVLVWLLVLTGSLEGVYVAEVGQNADLPCTYSPTTSDDLVPVCWGRGPCPVFECHSMVLSTDGRNLKYQTSNRYQLKRNIHKGDVSLTIENVTTTDSGTYCCRIQFPGPMNDKKLNLELVIKPAKVTSARTPWKDFTAAFPRMLTTKGRGTETQTLEALHDNQQTNSTQWWQSWGLNSELSDCKGPALKSLSFCEYGCFSARHQVSTTLKLPGMPGTLNEWGSTLKPIFIWGGGDSIY